MLVLVLLVRRSISTVTLSTITRITTNTYIYIERERDTSCRGLLRTPSQGSVGVWYFVRPVFGSVTDLFVKVYACVCV